MSKMSEFDIDRKVADSMYLEYGDYDAYIKKYQDIAVKEALLKHDKELMIEIRKYSKSPADCDGKENIVNVGVVEDLIKDSTKTNLKKEE